LLGAACFFDSGFLRGAAAGLSRLLDLDHRFLVYYEYYLVVILINVLLKLLCLGHTRVVALVTGTLESDRAIDTSESGMAAITMLVQLGLLYNVATTVTLKTMKLRVS
jgi:hypothetical protein